MRTETPRLTPERRALLADLMARLPGDEALEVGLYEHFGDELRRALVALSRQHDLPTPHGDDLDELAWAACGVLRVVARWWRSDGGALPWVYGRPRLVGLLRAHLGPPTRPLADRDLVEGATAPAVAPDDPPAVAVLDRLVRDGAHPVVARLHQALHEVVPARDHELVLRYAEQLAAGDPAPSHTVAVLVERRPDAVRQAFCRSRRRLRRLAIADARYRALLALPLLAGEGGDEERAA